MKRLFLLGSVLTLTGIASAQAPQPAKENAPPVRLSLEDQFERRQDIANRAGDVVILLYGDRDGMTASKDLGEKLHLHYHPTAKGQPPEKASKAPVSPLPDLPEGKRSPDVHVVPIVCFIKSGPVLRNLVRNQVKRNAPETSVWLDFDEKMRTQFGLTANVPNIAIIDASGRLRHQASGKLGGKDYDKLLETIDALRKEAAAAEK